MARPRSTLASLSALLLLILLAAMLDKRLSGFLGGLVSPDEHEHPPPKTPQQKSGHLDTREAVPPPEPAPPSNSFQTSSMSHGKLPEPEVLKPELPKPDKAPRGQRPPPPEVQDRRQATDLMRSHELQAPFVDRNQKDKESSEYPGNRRNACIVTLARNSDLNGVVHSIIQFEAMWNAQFTYPYVFLNDKPFSTEFIDGVKTALGEARGLKTEEIKDGADVSFGLVPEEHWSYPYWINLTIADQWRQDMSRAGVIYGGSESYRHMCRFYSGFFFRHPLLAKYKWYWRLEPDVDFYCRIDYDVFDFMESTGKRYGFNMLMKEIPETIPSLWPLSLHFAKYREINSTLIRFFVDPRTLDYNMCHFWTNFEIADLDLWRSPEYLDYFDYLDKWGGYFYERWGDAPVHSLAVGLFLRKDQVHFFDDIGYRHTENARCPKDHSTLAALVDSVHTSSDEDEVRRAARRRRSRAGSDALPVPLAVPITGASHLKEPVLAASLASSENSADLVSDAWMNVMDHAEAVAAAWKGDQVVGHIEENDPGQKGTHSARADLHVLIHPEEQPPPPHSHRVRAPSTISILASPTSISSAPCLSPKPTRPALVYNSVSQSSLSSIGTVSLPSSSSTPPVTPRRGSIDLVDAFEGECCAECLPPGWEPPPDFLYNLEYPPGTTRTVLFMHPDSRGRKPTRARDLSPTMRSTGGGSSRRRGLQSGTYYVSADDESDDGRFALSDDDAYGSSFPSHSSWISEDEDTVTEPDPLGAIRGSEPVLVMLPLKSNDLVVMHSRFHGPKVALPSDDTSEGQQPEVFDFEGDRDRNEVASGPETDWWCVGFRVAEPALEGCFPMRALKGYEKITVTNS